MKVSQVYEEYMIPRNLQEHMLRVAALAEILLEHWVGVQVDKNAIVQTCLFHDIAKHMNFDLAKQAQFGMSPEEIQKLDTLQKRLKTQYGGNEHQATVKIIESIGCSPKAVNLADYLEWKYIPHPLKNNNIEALIPIYCDMRVGPKGILTLKERINESANRTPGQKYEEFLKNGIALENILKENIKFDLNSIKDEQLNERFDRVLAVAI